jgi:hypothetical protein
MHKEGFDKLIAIFDATIDCTLYLYQVWSEFGVFNNMKTPLLFQVCIHMFNYFFVKISFNIF